MLDIFKFDPNYVENEKKWEQIKSEILGGDSDDGGDDGDDGSDDESSDEEVQFSDVRMKKM
jgi:pre-mRNA-splicing factor CWC22